ncbi:hypothetical protein TWF594_008879 [Orbilia oligospora]|nr:hypothetical protein TWF594_008879 [Orbilia oligospora]
MGQRENPPQEWKEERLNISGPHFARLEQSPAAPDEFPEVSPTSILGAPRWDDRSENGNPLVQDYECVREGPVGNEDEGRLLNLLDIYDVPANDLEKLAGLYLPFGFTNLKFPTIAKFLNIKRVEDIQYLPIYRSRVSIGDFDTLKESSLRRTRKYRVEPCPEVYDDANFRSILVSELLYEMVGFLPVLELNPMTVLGGWVGYKSARLNEASFACLGVNGLCYVAVDPKAEKGNDSDGTARLLAELAIFNDRNIQAGKWVPMLGILKIWASNWIPGLNGQLHDDMEGFLISLKIAVEYLYDFFIPMVFNSMRLRAREIRHANAKDPWDDELDIEESLSVLALNQCGEAHARARRAEGFRTDDRITKAEREARNSTQFMAASLKYWIEGIKRDRLPYRAWGLGAILRS